MRSNEPWTTRPYSDIRFSGGGHYWRPDIGIWRIWWVPPAIRAAVLYGVAACATSILAGINVWRAIAEHDDEIGD